MQINFHGWVGGGWVAGSIETKAISAFNLKLKLKLTEAELGNIGITSKGTHFGLNNMSSKGNN